MAEKWTVEGMTCTNCALTVSKFLERKGMSEVNVDFIGKEVKFTAAPNCDLDEIREGIEKLGYTVEGGPKSAGFWSVERRLLVCAIFTAPLLLPHLLMPLGIHLPIMHNGWAQLALALPVMLVGGSFFVRSALQSLRGAVPNMDVLIALGSVSAFVYSLVGLYLQNPDYYFFETAASVVTLVLVGNVLERRSVGQTRGAINALSALQQEKARVIVAVGSMESIVEINVEAVRPDDLLQINEGDIIPVDGLVQTGTAWVDESMLTGEGMPVEKRPGEAVASGTMLKGGSLRVRATAAVKNSTLSRIIEMVKQAQSEKPSMQKLADRIAAIFVPVVLVISLATFLANFFLFNASSGESLLRAIAVLVISCPCAMGLATPTAVVVGVGRLAQMGVLVKGAQTMETLAKIKRVAFDKTGTLTTGKFTVEEVKILDVVMGDVVMKDVTMKDVTMGDVAMGGGQNQALSILATLEQNSSHPIALSLLDWFSNINVQPLPADFFKEIKEEKGIGIHGIDQAGNTWSAGSFRVAAGIEGAPLGRSLYLTCEDSSSNSKKLVATAQLTDELRPEAVAVIQLLKGAGVQTLIISGDREEKTAQAATLLGVNQHYSQQLPEEKMALIRQLNAEGAVAMVGDGINDAPALALADIGISLGGASQAAIQSAQVILLKQNLMKIPEALRVSKLTVSTIKENLFWAFAYNVVAIPIAAMGFLTPAWGALFMAFSDVVVIGNSLRLRYRK